jgi:hypothetical protein
MNKVSGRWKGGRSLMKSVKTLTDSDRGKILRAYQAHKNPEKICSKYGYSRAQFAAVVAWTHAHLGGQAYLNAYISK